ncbi:MAG: hypothetical protein G01um101470_24 [Parcubacteria group bacterium Gr01-1014_70]|nr:MAG: hypothetical protein G01um101470_24 [Parcubacteria group bacterium Gr01-1014_70]
MEGNIAYHGAERIDSGVSFMKNIVFPYGIRFQEDSRMALFPAAEARIRGSRSSETLYGIFLIDSGATVSVLPAGDAELLGISLTKGIRTVVRGLGATDFFGYRHVITCLFEHVAIRLPVVFIDHPATLRILGREGLFEKYLIVFDELKHRTLFLNPKERTHINKLI